MLHLNPNRTVVLFVAAIISLVTGCSRESRIARDLEKGEQLFQQREFDQAEIKYLNVLKYSESHPDALRRLGRIYYEEGKVLRARSYLLKARDLDTNHLDTRLSMASWFCYAGQMFKEARDESLFVLTKDPGNDRALELLADSTATAKDVDDTRRQLERLRSAAAGKSGFHLAMGRLALRSNDLSAAESAFKQALALNPKSASVHLALAMLHLEKNDLKSAEQSYKTAAELAPVGSAVHLHYAIFKIQHGDAGGGKQLLAEMTKRTPWYLPAWNRLAELALADRNHEECAALIRKILLRDPANLDALFLSGRLSSAQRNFAKAITDFEQLVRLSPRAAPAHYQLAVAHLMNRGSTEMVEMETDAQRADRLTAVSHLQQAISLEANYTDAILLLSKLQISHGDHLAAIKRLSEYLEKRPKLESVYVLLADAYRVQNNYDQALAVGRRFAAAFPNKPEPLVLIGRALVQLKREAEARQAFHQALALSPNYFDALQQLVNMDINAKKYDSALALLRPLIDQSPKSAELHFLLEKVYQAQGAYDQAEDAGERALQLSVDSKTYPQALQKLETILAANPKDEIALKIMGRIYNEMKNYPAARDTYKKLLAVNPSSFVAMNELAELYSSQFGQLDKALELARRAHDLVPKDPFVTDTLGWILYKRGDYAGALTLLDESSDKLSSEPEAIFHLAMVHYTTGVEQKAKENFDRALQLKKDFPSHSEATNCLEVLAIDTRTGATAQKKLEGYLAQRTNDPVVMGKLGEVYEHKGDYGNAMKEYEGAIKANPKNAMVMLRLARIYASQGKDLKRGLELARTAHQVLPNNAEISALLGQLSYRSGDHALALNLLQQNAPRLPRDPQTHYYLAHALLSSGRIKEAENAMRAALQPNVSFTEKADAELFLSLIPLSENPSAVQATAAVDIDSILKTKPNYLPALWAGGRIREQRGSTNEAQQLYERIPAQHPGFAPALKRLAVLYSAQPAGLDKAYGYAVKARQALPEDPEAWYYLGMAHYRLKQPVESKKALNQALALKLPAPLAREAQKVIAELK